MNEPYEKSRSHTGTDPAAPLAISFNQLDELYVFKRQLLQAVPSSQIRWPSEEIWKNVESQKWISHNVFDTKSVKFAPSSRYRLHMLKQLVARIETVLAGEEEVRLFWPLRA
jgi:hypothetical protein